MSSLVSLALWSATMGNMPMIEGCTYEQMYAMYDAVKNVEDKEYAASQIAWYEKLWRIVKPKYDKALVQKDINEGYVQSYENLSESMKLIKQGIQYWREELSA